MKKVIHSLYSLTLIVLLFASCETIIDPELEQVENVLAVDAWINNKPGNQVIQVMMTQSYFDNALPPGVSGATVQVVNTTSGKVVTFTESNKKGAYVWSPSSSTELIGEPGDEFLLSIRANGESYEAISKMGRVPEIDSITFTFRKQNSFQPDSYVAEFWATDPAGVGDIYWIRATKNDTLLNKPGEITLAYDAGFSSGQGDFDGIQFIPPIREGINPFEFDEDDNLLSPYDPGDKLYVEIYSITLSSFNYLVQVATQTDRPGGFAELFSTPLANVSTNINNRNPDGKKAVGFFNVSAVSGAGKTLEK
jgi:Domain of unknown function (DUF4249)